MTELEYSEFLKGETDLEREAEIISLEHHGIKGQKHGVRRGPPYPLERGKGESTKKKKLSLLSRIKQKKPVKKETFPPKEKKEIKEEARKKALSSTDPKYIYKYRDLLSTNELQDRINRINKEKELKKLADGNSKSTMKTVEDFLRSSAAMAESVTKIYNSYNAVSSQMQRRQDVAKKREEVDRANRQKPNQNTQNRNKDKPSASEKK